MFRLHIFALAWRVRFWWWRRWLERWILIKMCCLPDCPAAILINILLLIFMYTYIFMFGYGVRLWLYVDVQPMDVRDQLCEVMIAARAIATISIRRTVVVAPRTSIYIFQSVWCISIWTCSPFFQRFINEKPMKIHIRLRFKRHVMAIYAPGALVSRSDETLDVYSKMPL